MFLFNLSSKELYMANKKFSFEEFNKEFWTFYRNKQLEIIKSMEEESKESIGNFDEELSGIKRKRLREI